MRHVFPLMLLLSGCVAVQAEEPCQDVIGLVDGTEIRGKLEEMRDGDFVMVKPDGVVVVIPSEKLQSIETCPVPTAQAGSAEPTISEPTPEPTPPEPSTVATPEPVPVSSDPRTASSEPMPLPSVERYPHRRLGTHVGFELAAVGAAVRLDHDVVKRGVDRVGLRVGIAGNIPVYSSSVGYAAFAQVSVTFGTRGPVRLEATSGPGIMLQARMPAWTGGAALLVGNRNVDFRLGLSGVFSLTDPYYMAFQPQAGVIVSF